MDNKIQGAYALQPVDTGRIFVRNLRENIGAFVGVIDVPAATPVEHLVMARINSRLWIDASEPVNMRDRSNWKEFVHESEVSSLLTSLSFRVAALPDAFEIGLRASEMKHEDPSRRWAIAFGAIKDIRGWPKEMQTDGLFEIGLGGPKMVSRDPLTGISIGSALRETVWGPGGKFGLAHCLDPEIYPIFTQSDRADKARKDDRFAQFLEKTRDLPGLPLVYTREQKEQNDQEIQMIVRSIMAIDLVRPIRQLTLDLGLENSTEARATGMFAPSP